MIHPVWSEERIQETIRVWQPDADRTTGEKLTRADAIEILNTMTNLAEFMIEVYYKDKRRASEIAKK